MDLRRLAVGSAAATLAVALPLSVLPQTSLAEAAPSAAATPRQAPRFEATITRTKHGIPHVVADDWGSLGYGHGYATAQTNLCNLADTLVTGRGERSRWFGPNARYDDQVTLNATNLQTDALFTDIRDRQVVEKLLADPRRGPGARARQMVRGYVAGINQQIRDAGGRRGVTDPACRGAGYIRPDATALDVWYGVYAANLLASTGVFVPQIVEAAPPTPGLPVPELGAGGFPAAPADLPSAEDLRADLGKDPDSPFGSNATAVGSRATSTGRGMLLGNPHFPWRSRYRFEQVQLTIPGTYDVAGASLIGSPVVNIGWNRRVAWSHTVSTAYRFTPYEYRTVPGSPTTYLTEDGPAELDRRVVRIRVKRANGDLATVTEDLYRTDQGYVLDDAATLQVWSPASFFALRDANAEQLRTVDTFLDMGRATDVHDLLRRQDGGARHAVGEHHRRRPVRRGDLRRPLRSAERPGRPRRSSARRRPVRCCSTSPAFPPWTGRARRADCAWRTDDDAQRPGHLRAVEPAARRPSRLGGQRQRQLLAAPPRRAARGLRADHRLRGVRAHAAHPDGLPLRDGPARRHRRAGAGAEGHAAHVAPLPAHQPRLRRRAGARERRPADRLRGRRRRPGLPGAAPPGTAAATSTSRGNHVFEEFWKRVPADGRWQVPFDPADPIGTPRDLNETNPQVVQAMRDALASLRERGVPFGATWGSLHVAGDEGAPLVGIGGGEGDTGNANVDLLPDAGGQPRPLLPRQLRLLAHPGGGLRATVAGWTPARS